MNTLISLLIIMNSVNLTVDNPCGVMLPRGIDEEWGSGLLFLPDSTEINLYTIPGGILEGIVKREENALYLIDESGEKSSAVWDDLEWIGFTAIVGLKTKPKADKDFYQVLWHGSGGGLWISKAELEKLGGNFFTYKDLLFDADITPRINQFRGWANIGINLADQCLNLRQGPSTNHEKTECLRANDWSTEDYSQIEILSTKADWAEVIVTTYTPNEEAGEGGDCDYLEKDKVTGWLKAIDQSGFPNIWFSLSSY